MSPTATSSPTTNLTALRHALVVAQFAVANLPKNFPGWPGKDLRRLGQLLQKGAVPGLTDHERELGTAFIQFA